jgi:hypothetical protein
MFMLAPPVLVSVTVCVAVEPISVAGKVRLDGDRDATAGVVPTSVTDCGLPPALSVMETAPLALPLLCGVKVTLIVQLVPPASDAGQLLVCAKGRLVAMLLMLRLAPPVFDNVTVCAALVVPMA